MAENKQEQKQKVRRKKATLKGVSADVAETVKVVSLITGLPEDQVLRDALSNFAEYKLINEQLSDVTIPQLIASAKALYMIYNTVANMVRTELDLRYTNLSYMAQVFEMIRDMQQKAMMLQLPQQVQQPHETSSKEMEKTEQALNYILAKLEMLEKRLEEKPREVVEQEVEQELNLLKEFVDLDTIKKVAKPAITNLIVNTIKYALVKSQSLFK